MSPTEDDLRRLLAQARVEAPMPDEIAARLDATLAGLVEARSAVVTPLRPRRRRAAALIAAAVVLVAGGAIALQSFDNHGSPTVLGPASTNAPAHADLASPKLPAQSPSTQSSRAPAPTAANGMLSGEAGAMVPLLRPDHFAADVRRELLATTYGSADSLSQLSAGTKSASGSSTCTTIPGVHLPTASTSHPARLGRTGVLVVIDGPDEHPRTATAYSCSTGARLAHAVLSR